MNFKQPQKQMKRAVTSTSFQFRALRALSENGFVSKRYPITLYQDRDALGRREYHYQEKLFNYSSRYPAIS